MTLILWTKKWAEETQKSFKFFKTLESSNTTAKALKDISHTPLLLIAQEQTNPYGRKGKKWNPSDFMATWTWQNSQPLSPVFSPLLGLHLYNSLQKIWPSDLWSLKAPNDIYLANKKTAGLLLETQIKKDYVQIILGLGVNVLKALKNFECIQNHHTVTESFWKKFLDYFWISFNDLINRKVSKISSDESKLLKQALQKNLQYKDLVQVTEDGSLVFQDRTLHWLDL